MAEVAERCCGGPASLQCSKKAPLPCFPRLLPAFCSKPLNLLYSLRLSAAAAVLSNFFSRSAESSTIFSLSSSLTSHYFSICLLSILITFHAIPSSLFLPYFSMLSPQSRPSFSGRNIRVSNLSVVSLLSSPRTLPHSLTPRLPSLHSSASLLQGLPCLSVYRLSLFP